MKQKEITINGKQYPVVFTMDTLMYFEDILNKSYFDSDLRTIKDRMGIIYAAALSADEDTKLTVEEMKGQGDLDAVNQIIVAYNTVMELASEFFKIPKVAADAEAEEQPEAEEGDQTAKN